MSKIAVIADAGASMRRRHFLFGLTLAAFVPSGALARKLKPYTGPEITRLVLNKGARKLYLLSGDQLV